MDKSICDGVCAIIFKYCTRYRYVLFVCYYILQINVPKQMLVELPFVNCVKWTVCGGQGRNKILNFIEKKKPQEISYVRKMFTDAKRFFFCLC